MVRNGIVVKYNNRRKFLRELAVKITGSDSVTTDNEHNVWGLGYGYWIVKEHDDGVFRLSNPAVSNEQLEIVERAINIIFRREEHENISRDRVSIGTGNERTSTGAMSG